MVEQSELRLVETRAKALLTISLTSRNDLVLHEQTDAYGVDFIVSITNNGAATSRIFGVLLKATVQSSDSTSVSFPAKTLSYYKDNPFPVCLCYFFMSNDKGFYKWPIEAIVDQDGNPRLTPAFDGGPLKSDRYSVSFKIAEFVELDLEGLSHLVRSVNDWYDARIMR